MWNSYDASLAISAGALKNGIEKLRDKVVSKGVLLDIARCMGVEHLEPGFGILPKDLDECADKEGVKIERGDFVIIRTGHMAKYLRKGVGRLCRWVCAGINLRICGMDIGRK